MPAGLTPYVSRHCVRSGTGHAVPSMQTQNCFLFLSRRIFSFPFVTVFPAAPFICNNRPLTQTYDTAYQLPNVCSQATAQWETMPRIKFYHSSSSQFPGESYLYKMGFILFISSLVKIFELVKSKQYRNPSGKYT